jgi:type III restriction enzyme
MHIYPVEVEAHPTYQEGAFLEDQLYAYNVEHTGYDDGTYLTLWVKSLTGGRLAGLHGWTWGGSCSIQDLWVHQDLRGQGYGTQLLHAAEQEARPRGCDPMVLSSFSFQAPGFYQKLGYEVTQRDLDKARQAARDIDKPGSQIKAIVSVMMLREGWDVRNVSVVLGLRPFTAKAEILPEQVIGRGLRLMTGIGPDRTQTLEVLGTRNLLNVLREQLEAEGVGVATTTSEPPRPVIIAPMQDRLAYDIAIPLTKPHLIHNDRKLSTLDLAAFEAIYDQTELEETFRINLKLEFATTETEVHQADLAAGAVPMAQELLRSITNKVLQRAKLPTAFAKLYPMVRTYVATRCFGRTVDVDSEAVRTHLRRLELQEGIARYLARQVAALTIEKRTIEFEKADF